MVVVDDVSGAGEAMIFKQTFVSALRKIGLLEYADYVKFLISGIRNYRDNRAFRRENAGIFSPPLYAL